MKVTTKGQVTIPRAIRQRLGIRPGSEVEFLVEGDSVKLKTADGDISYGHKVVKRMQGRATSGMSTDQIMALTRGEE